MKRSLRAEGPTRRGKPQPVGEVLEDIRENRPHGGEAAPLPSLPEPPARTTATGTVVRLCAASIWPTPPNLPTLPALIVPPKRFSAAYTLEEIAQSLETLASRCEAEAQRLPARASSLLQLAGLARISAWELRAEMLHG